MSVLNDQQLIRQFIDQKDHQAFAELVRRHVDWVCSMATRLCSGDRAMGEDVTQGVFVLLSRKATSLRRESQLSNWLFAVTRFCVKNSLRNEISRRKREKEAAAMRDEAAEPSDAPPWEELAPVLDEMVGKLRAGDREALLMRFYQSKTFPQIGAALRISEDAARKRVSRAIEQLRGSLAKQGVAVSAVVLGGLMSANLTHSASAAVVAGATAASAAASQSAGPIAHLTQLIMAFVSVKPVAVLVASIVLVSGTTAVLLQVNGGSAAAAPATMPATPKTSYLRLVTDDDKPVAGAKITRFAKRHEAFVQQRLIDTLASDADGRFQISETDETKEYTTILVQVPGFALSGGYLPKGTTTEAPGEIRIRPPSKLRLKFLDPDGKPAAGLRVRLAGVGNTSPAQRWTIEFPDSMADSFTQTADSDGVCIFPDLPQSGVAWIEPLDDRYVRMGWRQKFDLKDEALTDAGTVKLKAAGSISGKVIFADTKAPAAGVPIIARAKDYDGGVVDARTDEQGRYELKQLEAGTYAMIPFLSRKMAESYAGDGRDGVRVLAGLPTQDVDITLFSGGVVRGKVVEKATGEPLAGMQIFINPASHPFVGFSQDGQTGEDGTYVVHVPAGKVRAQFALPVPKGYTEPKPLSREFTIADGQTVDVNFDVPASHNAPISGKTVDGQGRPLGGVEILGQGKDDYPSGYSLTFSDANGNYTLPGIDPGTLLRARRGRWTTLQPVTAKAGEKNLVLTLRDDAAISARVQVSDPDGKPVAGASVELVSSRPGARQGYIYHDQKTTSADGSCLFKAISPDMEYGLVIEAKGFGPADVKLKLEPGKLVDVPLVKLIRADSFISGIVMDDQGNPLPDAQVGVSKEEPLGERFGRPRQVKTDIAGGFRVDQIIPGEVLTVAAWTEDGRRGELRAIPAGTENLIITVKPRPAGR